MAALQDYKCPCCGGNIQFDSSVQKLKCPYCDTVFEMDALRAMEEEKDSQRPDRASWEEKEGACWQEGESPDLRQFVCRSCGGEIITEETTAATACPYCGNPVTVTGNLSGMLKPDLVIPFQVDRAAAKESLTRYYRGKRLLPKVFRDENHIDEIRGIYVPFWLFDADANADITYAAKRTRLWSDSRYNYCETSHFRAIRSGRLSFRDIPVDGSQKMPDPLMESIEPFDLGKAVPFQPGYLSGFLADKYDVEGNSCRGRVKERVRTSVGDAFAGTVSGYDTVTVQSSSVRLSGGKAKYALLPVWMLSTTWRGQRYIFAMNGQTGKFVGDLPVDKSAYWKWWGAYAGGLTALFFLLLALAFGL